MKKKYQFAILISQLIISFLLIFYIIISSVYNFKFYYNNNFNYLLNLLSYLVQLISFSYLSIKIFQMNDPRRQSFTIVFSLALLFLSLNILLIVPTIYNTFNFFNFSKINIGKLNLFTLFCSILFLIFCGFKQDVKNIKNIKTEISFILFISLCLSYIIPLSSPTISNQFITLDLPLYSKILYIFLSVLAIYSFIPSYIQDKSSHNKYKTVSFILFVLSNSLLKTNNSLNIITLIIATSILMLSSLYLIINLKSYSI